MKIHEYQAKELFRKYKVPTPEGGVSDTVKGIVEVAANLGLPVAVKAQIHAGGRGKGGGVKIAKTSEEVTSAAEAILGMTLVTKQTGPEGRLVKTVLVEKGVAIKRNSISQSFQIEVLQPSLSLRARMAGWILRKLLRKRLSG